MTQSTASQEPPQWWPARDRVSVYVAAVVLAVAVYLASLKEGSFVDEKLRQIQEALINIGFNGVVNSTIEAVPVFESRKAKIVALCVMLAGLACASYRLWERFTAYLQRQEEDARIPTPAKTPQFTKRLSRDEYELQKMEHTRKELEKLTASEEFEKHMKNKQRS